MIALTFPSGMSLGSGDELQFTARVTCDEAGAPIAIELLTYRVVGDPVREAAEVALFEQQLEEL